MAQAVSLVIARYQEDLTWVNYLPPHVTPLVVTKGEDLPNEGREAASYIWAFQNHQWEDSDLIYCVQGDPFQHMPNLVPELYTSLQGTGPTCFLPLGNWVVECDGMGRPHHPGLPVAQSYEEWFGEPYPGKTRFAAGGQFAVTGRDIKSHDWSVWYSRACEEHGPWLLERLWREVFEVRKPTDVGSPELLLSEVQV